MIVSITATGTGVGVPEEFREAVSTAAAVTAFVNEYDPSLDTADYIGFDTGWSGSVPSPADGNQWVYDRDTPGMIEIALPLVVEPGKPGWNLRVEDRSLTTPPGSPTIGLFHIVGVGATGAWAGSDTCIAMWNGTSWQFELPVDGLAVWVGVEQAPCVYKTTAWAPLLESAFQSDQPGQFDDLVEKTTPVAADLIAIEDSASSYAKKKAQIGNLTVSPTAHASSHENGGADEISVAGLSGVLADAQTPTAHAVGGAEHTASTLANLNTKISDATLDDSGDPRTPTSHASSHSDGGSDEITVENLATVSATTTHVLSPDGVGGLVMREEGGGGGAAAAMDIIALTHSGSDDLNLATTDNVVPWNTSVEKDSGFTHDTVTNNSRIQVDADGTYLVNISLTVIGNPTSGTRYQGKARLRKNGTTDVGEPALISYARFTNSANRAGVDASWAVKLLDGDYVEVLVNRDSGRTTPMDMDESAFSIVRLQGTKGDTGATGSGTVDTDAVHVNLPGEISAVALATADSADHILIEDASDSNNKKRVTAAGVAASGPPQAHTLGGAAHTSATLAQLNALVSDANLDDSGATRTDAAAVHDNVAAEISALTLVTAVSGDHVLIEDASDSNNKKRVAASDFLGGGGSSFAYVNKGDSTGAVTIDWTAANYQRMRLTGNVTLTFTDPSNGDTSLVLEIEQDATGSRSVTWDPGATHPNGIVQQPETKEGSITVFRLSHNNGVYRVDPRAGGGGGYS